MRTLHFLPVLIASASLSAEPVTIKLWPDGAPEKADFKPQPEESVDKGDGILRTSHVSDPTITVHRAEKPNGTAVVVCPGGGYNILAIEHEGTKVCDWLNGLGVTGVLLKYRVPRRDNEQPHAAPLQDAQRAMGIVRKRAAEWGIQPDRIGILGFSAGGNLAVMTALHPNERTYTEDPNLDTDAKPNFMIPVYPAYLLTDDKNPTTLRPEITITKDSPPACFIHAADDRISATADALMYVQYAKLGIPAEVHIFAKGGHGFGMKPGTLAVSRWPQQVEGWMRSMGYLP
jgi:acetyl esterase/lipase